MAWCCVRGCRHARSELYAVAGQVIDWESDWIGCDWIAWRCAHACHHAAHFIPHHCCAVPSQSVPQGQPGRARPASTCRGRGVWLSGEGLLFRAVVKGRGHHSPGDASLGGLRPQTEQLRHTQPAPPHPARPTLFVDTGWLHQLVVRACAYRPPSQRTPAPSRLRLHASMQIATKTIAEGAAAARMAKEAGASWLDLNVGCPIYGACCPCPMHGSWSATVLSGGHKCEASGHLHVRHVHTPAHTPPPFPRHCTSLHAPARRSIATAHARTPRSVQPPS